MLLRRYNNRNAKPQVEPKVETPVKVEEPKVEKPKKSRK